ncbi:MAG: SDR family oxidoreductase [Vicingaceae bacterium]
MYETPFHKEDLSKYNFLIAGGGGFIGSNLVAYLLQHGAKKVKVLDNFANSDRGNSEEFFKHDNYELIQGDITHYEDCLKATEGIDFVSHQAALGSVPRSLKMPRATNEANVSGFVNMCTAARENGVKRMVYASSSSVYGDSQKMPKIEAEIGKPLSPYAVSKLTNELYGKVFFDNYGQELIGLRYFNVFGPRQSPKGAYAAVIPLFIQALKKEQSPFINGDGKQTRDFTFVENAVQANIKALFTEKNEALGEVFNVAVGERFSLVELFDFLNEIIGVDVAAVHREERAGDIRDSLANIDKGRELLGYDPQVRFKEGLEKTVEWFKSHDFK